MQHPGRSLYREIPITRLSQDDYAPLTLPQHRDFPFQYPDSPSLFFSKFY